MSNIYGEDGGQAFKLNKYVLGMSLENGEYYLIDDYGIAFEGQPATRGDIFYHDMSENRKVGNILGDKGDIPNFEFTKTSLTGTGIKNGTISVGGKEVAIQTQLSEDRQTVTIYLSSIPYPDVEIDSAAQEYKWEEQEGKWIFGIPTPSFEITEDGEVKYQIGSGEPETIGQAKVEQVENIVQVINNPNYDIIKLESNQPLNEALGEYQELLNIVRFTKREEQESVSVIRTVDWMLTKSGWKLIRNYIDKDKLNQPQTHIFGPLPAEEDIDRTAVYMVTNNGGKLNQVVHGGNTYDFGIDAKNVTYNNTTLDQVADKTCWYGLIDDETGEITTNPENDGEYTFFTSFNTGYVKDDTLILLDKYYSVDDEGVLTFKGVNNNDN